uniref:Protein kinase domain-containing protein n=1 Tax=Macrostomum lignano TaxID=282301 RepID=A0A1I8FD80_9PLAT
MVNLERSSAASLQLRALAHLFAHCVRGRARGAASDFMTTCKPFEKQWPASSACRCFISLACLPPLFVWHCTDGSRASSDTPRRVGQVRTQRVHGKSGQASAGHQRVTASQDTSGSGKSGHSGVTAKVGSAGHTGASGQRAKSGHSGSRPSQDSGHGSQAPPLDAAQRVTASQEHSARSRTHGSRQVRTQRVTARAASGDGHGKSDNSGHGEQVRNRRSGSAAKSGHTGQRGHGKSGHSGHGKSGHSGSRASQDTQRVTASQNTAGHGVTRVTASQDTAGHGKSGHSGSRQVRTQRVTARGCMAVSSYTVQPKAHTSVLAEYRSDFNFVSNSSGAMKYMVPFGPKPVLRPQVFSISLARPKSISLMTPSFSVKMYSPSDFCSHLRELQDVGMRESLEDLNSPLLHLDGSLQLPRLAGAAQGQHLDSHRLVAVLQSDRSRAQGGWTLCRARAGGGRGAASAVRKSFTSGMSALSCQPRGEEAEAAAGVEEIQAPLCTDCVSNNGDHGEPARREMDERRSETDCFRLKEMMIEQHFTLLLRRSDNSNLEWLVKELAATVSQFLTLEVTRPVHLAAQWQPVDSLQFIFDQIGAEMLGLKNNEGKTPADYVESYCYFRDQSAKRAWDSSTQRQLEASRPPLAAQRRLPPQLAPRSSWTPSFTDWDFILQDDKKQLIGRADSTVAVKVLPLSGTGQSGKLQRAVEMEKRGVEILKRLSHPNILQFLKCEQKSDGLYIFTELVSGHSLFELMQRQKKPFKESGVRDFSRQICSGLNFLHCQPEGAILHRDIKSSNIMLTNEGVIKLIDFGLAKEIEKTCGLSTGFGPKGTMYFMAPELFDTKLKSLLYSAKTDVWAFGCTVYELTAMQPPDGDQPIENIGILRFRKQKMPRIADGFSAGLKDFYLRCVDYDPRKRADTAELLRHSFLSASS